jgi:hypothetical protein
VACVLGREYWRGAVLRAKSRKMFCELFVIRSVNASVVETALNGKPGRL